MVIYALDKKTGYPIPGRCGISTVIWFPEEKSWAVSTVLAIPDVPHLKIELIADKEALDLVNHAWHLRESQKSTEEYCDRAREIRNKGKIEVY